MPDIQNIDNVENFENIVQDAPDYAFDDATIVVDRPHWRLVADFLAGLHVGAEFVADNEVLDLALIRLKHADAFAAGKMRPLDPTRIRRCPPDKTPGARCKDTTPVPEPTLPTHETPLECVVRVVREKMAAKYGGWVAEIGKNRYMQQVMPFPQSKPLLPKLLAADPPKYAQRPKDWIVQADPARTRVNVGVLDTRIFAHPSLSGHFVADPDDILTITAEPLHAWQGHATFVVGLIAVRAPNAQIMVRALFDRPNATVKPSVPFADAWDTAVGIAAFAGTCVKVLNLSLGCRTWDGRPPLVIRRAIETLQPGTLVVSAAGNHGDTSYWCAPTWPAALPGVVAVGARGACFNPDLPWMMVEADGDDVVSSYLKGARVESLSPDMYGDGYARWSGTSFAAATVTGEIAKAMSDGLPARQALLKVLEDEEKVVTPHNRSS